jgi:apolipoprotein N-acyltransferase
MWLPLALSAVLFFASYGLGEIWPLAWIAPVPVWIYCWRIRRNTWIAGAAFFLGSLNLASYYNEVLPLPVTVLALVLPSLLFWELTQLSLRCIHRLGWTAGVFAFPLFWTAIEWIRAQTSEHGTAGSIAYSQVEFIPILQVVSITGVLGLTFLLLLIPSALAAYWISRKTEVLAVPLLLLASTGAFGVARQRIAQAAPAVAVGVAATDATIRFNRTASEAEAIPVLEGYAKRIDALATRGAKFVLLPEKFVGVAPAYQDRAYRILSDAASRNQITLIAGLTLSGLPKLRNVAVVFGPRGEVKGTYDKQHMVPGWEADFQPGSRQLIIDNFGVAICKDFDFPAVTAAYAEQGVAMMFAPAWDFDRDDRLHSQMAVTRGVEHGFTLVRAAQVGLLTISDPFGRVLQEASTRGVPEVSILGDAPLGRIETIYARYGDWFGVACCLGSLLMAIGAWRGAGTRRNQLP